MGKVSVRLPPQTVKKLESEALLLSQIGNETVTVSELIRTCIAEKFPEVGARKLRESQVLVDLHQEVSRLREDHGLLARDVEKLVQTLAEMFPLLATREQVESLTDGIAAVIRSLKGR